MTSEADDVNKIMECLIRGDEVPSCLSDEGMPWPGPDEFLDSIFSLEDSSLGLLEPLPDFPLTVDPSALSDSLPGELSDLSTAYPDVPGSSCSDSGLSSDQAELTDYDQRLSPFFIQNTCSEPSSPQRSPRSDAQGSPTSSSEVDSSPQHAAPRNALPCLEDVQTCPVSDYEHPGSPQGVVEVETSWPTPIERPQKIVFRETFQNPQNRKRRPSATPKMAIVQPKVQKTITTAPVTVTSKPHVVVASQQQKQVKVANIQVINPQPRVFCKPNENIGQRKVIRVAPMAGNPRSILLPVTIKDMKDLRGIKIINAADLKSGSNIKLSAASILSQSKAQDVKMENLRPVDMDYDSNHTGIDDSMSDGSDEEDWGVRMPQPGPNKKNQYPRLMLTVEERKLLAKEGIKLPASYPLTKHEERELKRIRRKIRNKISAQDSRKRKKEYVDGLEDRVKQCSEENQTLMKRIRILQSQNQSLTAQLKRLQQVLSGGGGGKSAQPATCLLVLLMSVALVALPSLREAERAPAHTGPHAVANGEDVPHHALHRALLSATHKLSSEEIVVDDGEFNMDELVTFKSHSDHDYQVKKLEPRPGKLPPGYKDIPIDEDWPPNLKHRMKFDYDDGPDYLPLIKNENYEHFHDLKMDFAFNSDTGGKLILTEGSKLGELGMIAVKNEDIVTEEVNMERNSTVRSIVVNGTLANM